MKTSYKILSLIIVLIFLLGIVLFSLYNTEHKQQNELVKLTANQYEQTFENLLENNAAQDARQVEDYTYWDDMCNFVKTRDMVWAEQNLANIARNYELDQMLLIAPDFSTIVYAYPYEENQIPALVDQAKRMLKDLFIKRLMKTYFFERESGRIGVMYAATIHPTNDPQRLTKPKGYFFVVKYWDQDFFQKMEQLTGSALSIVSHRQPIAFTDESITFYKELKGYSGSSLAFLKISRPTPYLKLNHDFSKSVFTIFFISALMLVFLIFFSLYFLIGKPLGDLGYILKGNKELLPKFKTYGGEYVQIAEIIEKSITTQEELEKAKIRAEESDRLKSAFLANISHEIRTPMNAIIGFSQVLPDQFEDKEQLKECTDIIAERGQDLLDIVNSMIEMSRINAGSEHLQFIDCDLKILFEDLENQFLKIRKRIGKEHIEFTVPPIDQLQLKQILTDFTKLKEIFVHLLSNAFKFTREGKIEAGCFEDAEKGLVFFVKDTGKGIPKTMQKAIFSQFTRLNNDLIENLSGTGLGLAIVKGLIDLLEGQIWVESVPGKGSTFYFTVKYKQTTAVLKDGRYL